MNINKKLLPMKAQFFFSSAGAAPVIPFIPIIIRELGFSSVVVGWIFTVYPVLTILLKPTFGSIADKYKCQKSLLLGFLIVQLLSCYCLKFVPPLPTSHSVTLICGEELGITTFSDKLKEDCYANNILRNLNSTNTCKIHFVNIKQEIQGLMNEELLKDSLLVTEYKDIQSVQIDHGRVENNSIYLYMKNESLLFKIWSSACSSGLTSAELFCENRPLEELIQKPVISDREVTSTYQFWTIFILVISIRIAMSIVSSLVDTICFYYLGKKPENYGKQRMWGSIGWGLLSFSSGLIIDYMSKGTGGKDYSVSFYIMAFFFSLQIVILALTNVKQTNKSKSIAKDVKNLFKNAKICIFIVWCIVSGIYVSFVWNFLFWFIEDLASAGGCTDTTWLKTLEGLILTVETYMGELPFFFLSGRILRKIGHVHAMSLVLFTFGIRFLLYSSLSNPWWILPIEPLNGITFGIFYATMTTYASVISPPGTEATVQNLVTAIFEGVGTAIGGMLGGYLFKSMGSSQTFFVIGLSAIAFGFLHILAQRMTNKPKTDTYKSVSLKNVNNELENEDKGITFNTH